MRAALMASWLMLFGPVALGQQASYTSAEGQYRVRFPRPPKISEQTVKTALGDLHVVIATYATSEGNILMVSYTDYPAEAVQPAKVAALFDEIRDSVKTAEGKMAPGEKELTIGPEKYPGREFVVEKGRQRIKCQLILRGQRLYQITAMGSADFIKGRDATAFFKTFELTSN
ncbi:MAG: hypothetical protein RMJ56_11935 [Gemmataceae bacterium]|nr:hypothetical protein [Gemmata sp.]MDW8198301.1 hypothetical protein [Gemmataceae bacterium]